MDNFIKELKTDLIKLYNKENNTCFTEWWEIQTDQENKRINANIKAMTELYEITHKKGVK